MVFRFIMKFDNLLKLLCITLLFLYACTSNQLTNSADSCIIFAYIVLNVAKNYCLLLNYRYECLNFKNGRKN